MSENWRVNLLMIRVLDEIGWCNVLSIVMLIWIIVLKYLGIISYSKMWFIAFQVWVPEYHFAIIFILEKMSIGRQDGYVYFIGNSWKFQLSKGIIVDFRICDAVRSFFTFSWMSVGTIFGILRAGVTNSFHKQNLTKPNLTLPKI